ncbi:MAG: hypothetical protein AB1546_16820, partial [bacterium]
SVILLTIFIILFGAILFYALQLLHRSDLEIVTNQIRDLQAYYCAEAGIERAIERIRQVPNWPAGNPNNGAAAISWPGGDGATPDCTTDSPNSTIGTYTVYIEESRMDPSYTACYNKLTITSVGTAYSFTRRIRAVLRRTCVQTTGTYYTQILSWEEI